MRLQRVTTAGRWIPEIDGLRFIAIFSVLLVHIFDQMISHSSSRVALTDTHRELFGNMNMLGRGVQLFFVISGFILAQPFIRDYVDGGKPVSIRAFYKRRLTRLEPPYIFSLIIYASAMILARGAKIKAVALSFLSSLFYVHNFFSWLPPINFPAWSLEIEIQFYLIVPFLALIYLIRPTLLRRGFIVALILFAAMSPHATPDGIGFYLPGQICFFLIGNLLADLRISQRTSNIHWGWDVVSVFSWVALFLVPNRADSVLLCVLLFLCFCSSLLGPVSRRIVGTRWIALIGGMCYSIYLMHMIVISAIFGLTRHASHFSSVVVNYLIQLVLLLPPILAVSFVYYLLIERPCMNPDWPSKLWSSLIARRRHDECPPSPAVPDAPPSES
jgi:peptidoglycan/LPS O-acetylase OafA/YrhL